MLPHCSVVHLQITKFLQWQYKGQRAFHLRVKLKGHHVQSVTLLKTDSVVSMVRKTEGKRVSRAGRSGRQEGSRGIVYDVAWEKRGCQPEQAWETLRQRDRCLFSPVLLCEHAGEQEASNIIKIYSCRSNLIVGDDLFGKQTKAL